MLRVFSLIAAFVASTLMVGSAAFAQPSPAFYAAVPASAPAAGRAVVRDLLWTCDGQACVAGQGTSRAAVVCATAAGKLGKLTAFRAGEEQFDATALDKCNARAK